MGRRRFKHLHTELSVAVGELVPRYALWRYLEARGWAPEGLTRDAVLSFQRGHLAAFLEEQRLTLSARSERRLTRSLERFDPHRATPEETLERFASAF